MGAAAIIALVGELISEGAKLVTSIVDATQQQLAEAEAKARAALSALKDDRRAAEREMDQRHAEFEAAQKEANAVKVVEGEFNAVRTALFRLDDNEISALVAEATARLEASSPANGERPAPGGSSER